LRKKKEKKMGLTKQQKSCRKNAEKSKGTQKKGIECHQNNVEVIQEPKNKNGVMIRRCDHQYENGSFCKKKQCYEFCDKHSLKDCKVKVCNSLIDPSFKGLFAFNGNYASKAIVFRKNDVIAEYKGVVLTLEEKVALYGEKQPSYVVGLSKELFIDCKDYRCLASMINTSRKTNGRFTANCCFSICAAKKSCKILATTNIRNFKEILNSYYLPNHVIIS